MLARLKAVLPLRWFPDATPILDALITGLASTWSTLYAMLAYVKAADPHRDRHRQLRRSRGPGLLRHRD